jgi:hypothetical protein
MVDEYSLATKLIDKYFSDLIVLYKFEKITSEVARNESGTIYRNKTLEITLYFEISKDYIGEPSILISDTARQINVSLSVLLAALGVAELPKFQDMNRKKLKTIEELEKELIQKSQKLFTYAVDLLKGDLSIMPRLEELEQERQQDYLKYRKHKT